MLEDQMSLMLRVLVSLALLWRTLHAHKLSLRVDSSNTFQISIFSDLHFGEDEDSFGIAQDDNSTRLMRHVLDVEQPDLAVLNGDLITGENTYGFNSTRYVDHIVQPLVEGSYRWASTYGNHDSKYNLSREALFAEESKYKNSYTQHGPKDTDGVTNYVLPLYSHASTLDDLTQATLQDSDPIALLYFLDSRGGSHNDPTNLDNIPDFVTARTAEWLNRTHHDLQSKHGVLPSLLVVHIPVQAFSDLQNQTRPSVSSPKYPGMNADEVNQQGTGHVGNASNEYAGQDIPFMQVMLGMEGLHSIYSSHDHGNAWCGLWPNETNPSSPSLNQGEFYASNGRPFLCFTKHSGFGGYGHWNRGSRQVLLRFGQEGLEVDTWVRMQQGSEDEIITRVGLNATYGVDTYDTGDGGMHPTSTVEGT